jgi:hypothetical protein
MNITITKELAEAIGVVKLKRFGVTNEKIRWNSTSVSLASLPTARVRQLRELVTPHATTVAGTRRTITDLNVWIEAAEKGADKVKCRSAKHFAALVHEYLQKIAPKHWLYSKDEDRDCWFAYYVGEVQYVPEERRRDYRTPAHTILGLYWEELGRAHKTTVSVTGAEVHGCTVVEVLANEGYVIESDSLAATYAAEQTRYLDIHDKVGRQFLATGVGTSDLDGNDKKRQGWWHYGFDTVLLERDGVPSRVVIDVIQEGDKKDNDHDNMPDRRYWQAKSFLDADEDAHGDDDIHPEDVEEDARPTYEMAIRPVVPVFDFKRHLRLRVHVANLTDYAYDRSLGDKLVLPADSRRLVDMLVAHKGGFADIIAHKGGGAIILCAGVPGTGKTLTAEVYAEVMERPLYSVQCSQLGVDPTELEDELLKTFARARRWNAILLLDEADVYVAARGSNLEQNAIVGVFLRVLEYYGGVLFLTTNRSDLVDDAIASRCIARIDYTVPTVEDQRRIWAILANVMGVPLAPATIHRITAKIPTLTGRDIKNLLKLAVLVTSADGRPITEEVINFVRRFKPTGDPGDGNGRPTTATVAIERPRFDRPLPGAQ